MDPQLEKLLQEHASFLRLSENGKVTCTLNNHDFPARFDAVSTFVSGPKYQKLLKTHEDTQFIKTLDPFLVPSKNYPDQLFCALTCQLLTNTADSARKHMAGKRFKRHQELFQNDELELFEEPLLESMSEGEADAQADDMQRDEDEEAVFEAMDTDAVPSCAYADVGPPAGTPVDPPKSKKQRAQKGQSNGAAQIALPHTPSPVPKTQKAARNPNRPSKSKRARKAG